MSRPLKWSLRALAALLLVLAGALLVAQHWVARPEFRQRIEQEAGTALGVPLQLERVGMAFWPLPGVVLEGAVVRTRHPLKVERIELRPAWGQLLLGRLALSTLVVRRASLPQTGIDALLASVQRLQRRPAAPAGGLPLYLLPRHTVLDEVSWTSSQGRTLTVQAEAQLDSDAWPERMELEIVRGRLQGTRLDLRRSASRAWEVTLKVAGGTVRGRVELQPAATTGGEFALKGQLQTQGVEVAQLTAPEPTQAAREAQPLSGRLEASTTWSARARQPSTLLEGLQSQSKFTVHGAVVHGVDLVKAVQTVGVSRGGETRLDTLSGQVGTRGKAIELQNLAASSGALSATGQVSVSPTQQLSGRVNAGIGGAVGVPLAVGGTVDAPEVTLTTGAKIGAALGTMLMPGVGTGAGASVGGKLGELLGK